MKTPGITVRPIQTLDGGHEVNEGFFVTGILFQIDATPTANARPHHNTVGYLALSANRVNPDGYLMAGGRMSVPADFGHFRLFVRAVIDRKSVV